MSDFNFYENDILKEKNNIDLLPESQQKQIKILELEIKKIKSKIKKYSKIKKRSDESKKKII